MSDFRTEGVGVSTDAFTPYGFRWGPMTVERCIEHRGTRVVLVKTEGHTLEIAVSPKGNSVRAWLDHERLVPDEHC